MNSRKKKIIAVFKTHFDYGYTDRKEIVLQAYSKEKLEQVLDICERTQYLGSNSCYKWTVCSFLLMSMYNNATEYNKERMRVLIEKGQIVCHALPFTMHTSLLDEQLAENMFLWTEDYTRYFNKPFPISAKMTDVPGHTSGIIQPLVNRGVKFLHLGKNGASLAPNVPMLFWWEDLRGNRILTMYNRDYGSNLTPPKNWRYPVWLAFCHTYDNVGVQSEKYLTDILDETKDKYELVTGTLDDFAEALLKCDLSDLPVIKGELGDTWVHGIGTYPKAVSQFRRSKTEFYRLEELAKKQGIDISKEKRAFYENALIYTEHTFGINILKYFPRERVYDKETLKVRRKTDPIYIFAEKSWEDERIFARNIENICKKIRGRCETQTKGSQETYPLHIETSDKYIYLNYKGKQIKLYYEYRIFGAESVHRFTKQYLTRIVDWSISDFGKLWYPEIGDKKFIAKIKEIKQSENSWEFSFDSPQESVEDFGNFKNYTIKIEQTFNGIEISLSGKGKEAINLVEAGNLVVDLLGEGQSFFVEQIGSKVDVNRDIVRNANQVLWAMDNYAEIDGVQLYSYDAPLVSFEKSAICQYNGGKKKKKRAIFVVNLFNNHWGTNFPQWMEGDYEYGFCLRSVNNENES